jgi:hypothetical protein
MPYSPHEKQPKHNPVSAKFEICARALQRHIEKIGGAVIGAGIIDQHADLDIRS